MRKIERTRQFKRDYKREARRSGTLDEAMLPVLQALVQDRTLATRYRDHALTGNWRDHRDCHIRPDLVLIYRKPGDQVLQLVRIGSHSELGL